jgi:hypothetical protein
MNEDKLSAEEYLIFKESLDQITPQLDIDVMVAYLLLKVKQRDWHGVSDAANDIREMEAYLSSMPTLTVVPKEKNT